MVRSLAISCIAALFVAGCGDELDTAVLDTVGQPIAAGTTVKDKPFVGRLPPGSAVAIAPTLVLSSRHQIVSVASDQRSGSAALCRVSSNFLNLSALTVRFGANDTDSRDYPVKRIFADYTSSDCTNDIAVLELSSPIEGMSFPPLRLDTLPAVGDAVTGVGWGTTEVGSSSEPHERTGRVLGLDGAASYSTAVGSVQFPFPSGAVMVASDVSACRGDSGGALLDAQGNLIGLTVWVGHAADNGFAVESTCDTNTMSLALPLAQKTQFIERVFRSFDRMPTRAGKPPPAEFGGACALNNECHSNLCVKVGDQGLCTKGCTQDSECQDGFTCSTASDEGAVCLNIVQLPEARGCSATSANGQWAGAAAALILLGVGALRRRRSSSSV